MIKRVTVVTLLTISTAALARPKRAPKAPPAPAAPKLVADDLPGPQPEVAHRPAKLDVPAVPGFELPAVEPGFHGPRELRVHGKALLGTEIKVKGYVTWIYDCVASLASKNPSVTRNQLQAAIEKDPSLCERPKFYLGDRKTTPRDQSIWVVDAPRAPYKAERDRLPKEELKAWPAVPRLAVGDYVIVTGNWAIYSPHNEHNTDGLLVYRGLEHGKPVAVAAAAAQVVATAAEPEIAVVTKAPLRKPVDDETRNLSVGHLNACNKAIAARQYDDAIRACEASTDAWDANHLAWYARASAHMAKNEWGKAVTAVERAVTMRPELGMYQLYYGISLYEHQRQLAREDRARKDGKQPDDSMIDPSTLKLEGARDALVRATKLAPELWRAHYYLGRVYRDLDDAKRAAEQFSQTIQTHPSYRFGYIALIELYRRWDYVDQALAVALLGTAHVPPAEAAELWFEVGMAHDAKHADDQAIEAFGKAIASKPDDIRSKFQRGQVYLRKADLPRAKADLEEVARSTDPRLLSAKQVAIQLLNQIAKRKP